MDEIKKLTDEKLEEINGGLRKPYHLNLTMYCPICKTIHGGIERHPGKKTIDGNDYQMYYCPVQNGYFATSGSSFFDLGPGGWSTIAGLFQ